MTPSHRYKQYQIGWVMKSSPPQIYSLPYVPYLTRSCLLLISFPQNILPLSPPYLIPSAFSHLIAASLINLSLLLNRHLAGNLNLSPLTD